MAVNTRLSMMAGPAGKRIHRPFANSPAAAVPTVAKMPAPMMAPIPRKKRSVAVRTRLRPVLAASAASASRLFRRVRSASRKGSFSALGQPEDPLADDVALDLAGAARDRVLPRADDAVVPARRVRHRLARAVHEHVGPEQVARE